MAQYIITKFLKTHPSDWVGWRYQRVLFFKRDILTFTTEMHCRIQQWLHKLIQKEKQFKSAKTENHCTNLSPFELNQIFKTSRHHIPGIIK